MTAADTALATVAHRLFDDYALTGSRPTVTPEMHPDHGSKGEVLGQQEMVALSLMLDRFVQYQPSEPTP